MRYLKDKAGDNHVIMATLNSYYTTPLRNPKLGVDIATFTPIARLAEDGTISGGMIPKLETCVHAVEAGCEATVVLDGRVPHAMLLEIFTARGAGTLIRA